MSTFRRKPRHFQVWDDRGRIIAIFTGDWSLEELRREAAGEYTKVISKDKTTEYHVIQVKEESYFEIKGVLKLRIYPNYRIAEL